MWRDDPATQKQKNLLTFFGCTWEGNITKGQAADTINECAGKFPERYREYYARPATEEQLIKLRELLKPDDEVPEDYADPDQPLTYGQAKDLLEEFRLQERQAQEQELDREIEGYLRARDGETKHNQNWFGPSDSPSEIESKAKVILALNGLKRVRVFAASCKEKIILNLDVDTDEELAMAAKALEIRKSDCS